MEKEELKKNFKIIEDLAKQTTIAVKVKLENEKNKILIESLIKENEELRKQISQMKLKKYIEADENIEEIEKIKKELTTKKAIIRYMKLGMDEELAQKATKAEVNRDMEAWAEIIARHIKNVK